jgi:hypothetical protein
MTGTGISKSVLIDAMQKDVQKRFGIPAPKFKKIWLITPGGMITDFDNTERRYVEY